MVKALIITFIFAFLFTAIAEKLIIPMLKKLKMGQSILQIGPSWHNVKQGTPTMGGLIFILCALCICLYMALIYEKDRALLFCVSYASLNGLIGIIDDLIKLKRKQNEGLSATAKFLLQLAAAVLFVAALVGYGIVETKIYIPFFKTEADIGVIYYPFALLLLTGFTNAVNLTDGLDGLCSSVSAAVCIFFAAILIKAENFAGSVLSVALLGILLGFLIYNFHPAKVFMGDTGSLFIGGVIGATALVSGKNTVIFIVGAVYLLETTSVILQVLYYKLTKKRLFLMAPYHHHLEKKGLSEVRIVLTLTAITLLLCVFSYFLA